MLMKKPTSVLLITSCSLLTPTIGGGLEVECVVGGDVEVCVSSLTGEIVQLNSVDRGDSGFVHALGIGSGTSLAGCALAPATQPKVTSKAGQVVVARKLTCETSFWNPRGGQTAWVTDTFTAIKGAVKWQVNVSSPDSRPWTTAIQSRVQWEDFDNAQIWVGGPTTDKPAELEYDPLEPFDPPAGRLNYAYGGLIMFTDYPTPDAAWTPGAQSGIPLPLVTRIEKNMDVGISWAQDARDSPPVAQLLIDRYTNGSSRVFDPELGKFGLNRNASWFVAMDYNAVYGQRHDVHGKFHLSGKMDSWQACESNCSANASCLIFSWSEASLECWWRLDRDWGAIDTLTKQPRQISGCFNGFDRNGQKLVAACGQNPIPGPHPPPPEPPGPAPPPVPPAGPQLHLNFSRQYSRLGQDSVPVIWNQYFYAHAGDWRPAVDFLVKRWPKHFFVDHSINSTEVSGPGSYTDFRGGMRSDEASKYQRMGYTLNWDASFQYPYHGLWLPYAPEYGPEWTTCFGHYPPDTHASGACYNTSYAKIRGYYEDMHNHGFRTCAYGNLFEYGSQVVEEEVAQKERCIPPYEDAGIAVDNACRKDDLAKCREIHCKSQDFFQRMFNETGSVLRDLATGKMIYGGMGGAVVMDPGMDQYVDHLARLSQTIMKETPCTGLCIDRQDWIGRLNYARDDGVTWYEAQGSRKGGQPVAGMIHSWKKAMKRLGSLWHSKPNQPLLINTLTYRLDMMEFVDGIFDEYGDIPHKMFASALAGLARPALMWNHPGQSNVHPENIDGFLQQHLHFGVWPALPIKNNDHMIAPGPWDDVFELYGPLFTAYRGRVWLLEPHAVKIVNGSALANAFTTPHGVIAALTFASKKPQTEVQVQLQMSFLRSSRGRNSARVLRPDGKAPVLIECRAGDSISILKCSVPVARGCALLVISEQQEQGWPALETALWV